jgi:class 3 adenylate cyclase
MKSLMWNERTNVAGAGVDIAQRVMDCGDAGHILLSKRVADDLAPYSRWHPNLHDLGECEVKARSESFAREFLHGRNWKSRAADKMCHGERETVCEIGIYI